MTTMTATEVKNHIGDLWDSADIEPVMVERNGTPRYVVAAHDKYVVVSREEYDQLRGAAPTPRLGFAKEFFDDLDTDALLNVDLSHTMQEYL